VELRIPFVTLLKIALAVLLVVVVINLWPVVLMVIVAVLIAVMLDPIPVMLERRGLRRSITVLVLALVMFGFVVALFVVVVPSISAQIGEMKKDWPQVEQRLDRAFPPMAQLIRSARSETMQTPGWVQRSVTAGKFALEGTTTVVLVLVIAMYLLLEGRGALVWLIDFAPRPQRPRIRQTADEIRDVMLAYMRGSVITATICGVYVFVALTVLGVPLALLLGVFAFILDFIPVVGTIVMAAVSSVFALLVSPGRALIVAAAILAYHAVEAYVLIPRIWGSQMRVSTLTVLLGITIGATLQGPIGAVLALPVAAAYPIIERIWLRDRLPSDTVERHEEQQENSSS
jgi:predicted PurR-regulated permease PerM